MNGEDAREPEWGFEMRTQSDADRCEGAAPRAEGLREALQAYFGEMLSPMEYNAIVRIASEHARLSGERGE